MLFVYWVLVTFFIKVSPQTRPMEQKLLFESPRNFWPLSDPGDTSKNKTQPKVVQKFIKKSS
ncbi:MAG: hypothetical protein HC913_05750 [Microscillaceae bacterium]|nr:hypothetical protein [Microscillaceae bacterium]